MFLHFCLHKLFINVMNSLFLMDLKKICIHKVDKDKNDEESNINLIWKPNNSS